jgi:hypothetical protein
MAVNAQTAPASAPKTVWDTMEEDSQKADGFFWTPEKGKINKITMVYDEPIQGMTNYKTGTQRKKYTFVLVTAEDPETARAWGMSAKSAMQQMIAIIRANKLVSVKGLTVQVVVTGEGVKTEYVILPVEMPTAAAVATITAKFPLAKLKELMPKVFDPQAPAPAQGGAQ